MDGIKNLWFEVIFTNIADCLILYGISYNLSRLQRETPTKIEFVYLLRLGLAGSLHPSFAGITDIKIISNIIWFCHSNHIEKQANKLIPDATDRFSFFLIIVEPSNNVTNITIPGLVSCRPTHI